MFLKPRHRTAPTKFPRPLKKEVFGEGQTDTSGDWEGGEDGRDPVWNPTRYESYVLYFELIAVMVIEDEG